MKKPNPGEYPEYYNKYIKLVPDKPLIKALEDSYIATVRMLDEVDPDDEDYSYADGKWTIKEVIAHLCDSERIFAYRILRISRGDKTPLPGFEQNDYIPTCNASARTLSDLLIEFSNIRRSTIDLLKGCSPDMLDQVGTASNWQVSALALAFTICGHEIHHQGILCERYLKQLTLK